MPLDPAVLRRIAAPPRLHLVRRIGQRTGTDREASASAKAVLPKRWGSSRLISIAWHSILAQSQKARVPQQAVVGPSLEAHLGHQLRSDPRRTALGCRRHQAEWRLVQ